MKDEHDIRKEKLVDAQIAQAEHKAELEAKPELIPCACVHHDAYECARIRDRIDDAPDPFDDPNPRDQERRACECCCHEKDQDELEDVPW